MQRAWRNIDVDRHVEQEIRGNIMPVNYCNGIMQCLQMENRTRLKTCYGQDMYDTIWYSVFCGTFEKSNIELNARAERHRELPLMRP